jgi:hypothetical protein
MYILKKINGAIIQKNKYYNVHASGEKFYSSGNLVA